MIPPNVHYHHLHPPLGNDSVNGTLADAPSYPLHHDAPHSAHLESTNVEHSAHSIPHAQYPTPVPALTLRPPAYSEAPYQSQAHGIRWGKAPRALQVRQRERESCAGGQVKQLLTALGLLPMSGEKVQMR